MEVMLAKGLQAVDNEDVFGAKRLYQQYLDDAHLAGSVQHDHDTTAGMEMPKLFMGEEARNALDYGLAFDSADKSAAFEGKQAQLDAVSAMEREAFIIGFSLFDLPGVQERWDELYKQIVELTA